MLIYFMMLFMAIIGIIESRQTIYSLLWLMAVFISGALVFLEIGVDIIGLLLIIVYVGAIGMFFLFMIMLLTEMADGGPKSVSFLEIGLGVSTILYCMPKTVDLLWAALERGDNWMEEVWSNADLGSIGMILYEQNGWALIVLSLLLLNAMIIAIDIAKKK